jgi:ATP-dependent DNA helicase RecG
MRQFGAYDARQLMELAVGVMRYSVDEPRRDGKACPKVGAVLWKPDDTVDTAYRGELRDGDHAEFTLLERKHRSDNLKGSVLFATLEPCAPDARHPPKMGCAERIVLARIQEVWVGIEDPDPTVDRKGIKYLQDHGVTVHMFDRDLQEIIQAENQQFIEQALERATTADIEPRPIILSTLEQPLPHCGIDHLSTEALETFRSAAGITDPVRSPLFQDRLVRLGLLKLEDGRFVPTGFGVLLFDQQPRDPLPQAGLLGTIHYHGGMQEIKDFDGPQILAPGQAIDWLRDKLPNLIDRSEAQRREVNAPLYEIVREGIVNALVHRDYGIAGAKCQLVVTSDTIVIWSPGLPVEPITFEELQSFDAPMLSRNPPLHRVFAQMDLAEERGLGLRSVKDRAQQMGLPLPRYRWRSPYVLLTIYGSPEAALSELPSDLRGLLSTSERNGWQWLTSAGHTTSREYAQAMNVEDRTARRHLNHFLELGLVKKRGSGPSTEYEVA